MCVCVCVCVCVSLGVARVVQIGQDKGGRGILPPGLLPMGAPPPVVSSRLSLSALTQLSSSPSALSLPWLPTNVNTAPIPEFCVVFKDSLFLFCSTPNPPPSAPQTPSLWFPVSVHLPLLGINVSLPFFTWMTPLHLQGFLQEVFLNCRHLCLLYCVNRYHPKPYI